MNLELIHSNLCHDSSKPRDFIEDENMFLKQLFHARALDKKCRDTYLIEKSMRKCCHINSINHEPCDRMVHWESENAIFN